VSRYTHPEPFVTQQGTSLENLVMFRNSRGLSGRGTLLHLTRHSVALEVYNPFSIVQLSEVLNEVRILRQERAIYQGRAVITNLVPTGALTIVSAALIDPWSDLSGLATTDDIRLETERFIGAWEDGYKVRAPYQLAVNGLASFLQELDRWLGQAEALYQQEGGSAQGGLFEQIWPPLEKKLAELFGDFEAAARDVPPAEAPVHRAFAQRELHPLLLCDPFIHRSFTKPLGYAGDYQIVNMILKALGQCTTTYARVVSEFNLSRAPAVAHRNRIQILERLLSAEVRRKSAAGGRLRVLNVGCGPATEVERFILNDEASTDCELTLVDFSEETLEYAAARIVRARETARRKLRITTLHQSIHELLKAAASGQSSLAGEYDFVYCAGLFDYLSDRVCSRLLRLFYAWTASGGLTLATNVHAANPIRYYMAHIAEWHLEYRDEKSFLALARAPLPARVHTDETGVNLFLELRRPEA
jgi:extracellular factor (EF) 3-hydroxypalmitic acid methyl ester biosynthesis protein